MKMASDKHSQRGVIMAGLSSNRRNAVYLTSGRCRQQTVNTKVILDIENHFYKPAGCARIISIPSLHFFSVNALHKQVAKAEFSV